jgi:hypothetical protein
MHTDYIPTTDINFNLWFVALVAYVISKCTGATPVWPHIPEAVRLELSAQLDAWNAAWATAQSVPTNVNKREKTRVRTVAEKFVRDFVNQYLRFPPVTDEDRDVMGIRNRNPHPSTKPAPTDHVEFEFTLDPQSHTIRVSYRIAGSTRRGKGTYHGVEVRFWVLPMDAPVPITANTEGWRSEVDTASPWAHTFDAAEIGQRLYVAMRWENQSAGKDQSAGKGPWSAIQSVVIA